MTPKLNFSERSRGPDAIFRGDMLFALFVNPCDSTTLFWHSPPPPESPKQNGQKLHLPLLHPRFSSTPLFSLRLRLSLFFSFSSIPRRDHRDPLIYLFAVC
ncbi:hypothetical protein VTN96DRAFT_5412 [Rasamsonia emersonii]